MSDSLESKPNIINADYVKHMVECKCIHPMFKDSDPPVFHKFTVFSELDPTTCDIKLTYAQCNNCGMIHKITGLGKITEVLRKEETSLLPSIEDIQSCIPNNFIKLLEKYEAPLHVWQEVQFILDHKLWGKFVILSKEKDSRESTVLKGKYAYILGESLMKIETFEYDDGYINI